MDPLETSFRISPNNYSSNKTNLTSLSYLKYRSFSTGDYRYMKCTIVDCLRFITITSMVQSIKESYARM